jgi:hypothetical protein
MLEKRTKHGKGTSKIRPECVICIIEYGLKRKQAAPGAGKML